MWYLTVHSHNCVPPYLITIIFIRWCASSFRACTIYLSISISADHLMVPLLVVFRTAYQERVLPLFRKVYFSAEPSIILLHSHSVLFLYRCFVVALIMIRIYTTERDFYLWMCGLTIYDHFIAREVGHRSFEIVVFTTCYLSSPLWISHESRNVVLAFLIVINPLLSLLYLFLFSNGQLFHEKNFFLIDSIISVIFVFLALW